MTEIKKAGRGGYRPGAGRKSTTLKPRETSDGPAGGEAVPVSDQGYVPKVDPVKELEKLYKSIDKVENKADMAKLQLKIDLLNKMLPYLSYKKPVADQVKDDKPTEVKIEGIDLTKL